MIKSDIVLSVEDQEEDEKAYAAYNLSITGMPAAKIAKKVGFANAQVVHVVIGAYLQRASLELTTERREEVLQKQTDRIEALIYSQWDMATLDRDTKAAEFCLKAIDKLSKLYGLETLHEKTSTGNRTIVIAGNAQEYTEALKAIAAGD